MSFGDTVAAGLGEMRAHAESLMVDECVITRAGGGRGPWNPDIDDYDPPSRSTVYTGPCQVQVVEMLPQDVVAGEAALEWQRVFVKLPIATSTGVRKDDDVEITVATHDPDLLGRHFTVQGLHHKTFATARRLPCVEVV